MAATENTMTLEVNGLHMSSFMLFSICATYCTLFLPETA